MVTSGKREKKGIGYTPFVIYIFNLQVSGKSTENVLLPLRGEVAGKTTECYQLSVRAWQFKKMVGVVSNSEVNIK